MKCRTFAAALTAAVVCTATTGSYSGAPPTAPRGHAFSIPVVLMGAVDEAPTTLGIADSTLYTLLEQDIDVTLDHLKDLGVNAIRIAVPWVYIEPKDNEDYNWSKMDYVVHAASERGMNIVGVITGTPTWAGFPLNGHSNPTDYAQFAAAVAARYNDASSIGAIDDYEIWNEPNGALFYNPVDAKAYTRMLQAAYPVIKANNPNAEVIAGVLGAVVTVPGLSLAPEAFVRQMYNAGAQGYFDALSYHPYNYTLPFSMGQTQANSPLKQVQAIRALMVANGDADLKIWATEYGLPTNFPVDQQEQAAFIHDFVVAWQDVEGAGPMFIYTTRDSNTGGFDDEENFGLFKTDWTPKKAAVTVEELIQQLESGNLQPFDVTPYANNTSFLESAVIVIRQIINLALIVPKALYRLAVSAVTVITEAIGSLFGVTPPAAAAGTPHKSVSEKTDRVTPTTAKSAAAQQDHTSIAHAAPRPNLSVPRTTAADKSPVSAASTVDKPKTAKAGASTSTPLRPTGRHTGGPALRPSTR
ncbi:cellulase family glycosylhydrolase [Mycobacterium sp. CVI_P3]|uniref:Cellulase family glycosylhydrolase n=1 Tax=Mycobacterium pinniadriaticum TaxID=2994102 RepID=A0ABT3SE27_9MYCO|nr:cellulase family glycosylhydrolase [Mycobacterium pinniadriaticum]MCX2931337.1 cellulase family glycosylhydrolase [Mycobacterium pinniadriaticum]MCX2937761.1 cellulase family glycosylhydrolase [Mycobacterium pinniadriaticum]